MSVSVVQVATSQTNTATFSANVTPGNTVFVVAHGYATAGWVVNTSGVTLGGQTVTKTLQLQGSQSDNAGKPSAGHAVWMLPNCSGGSKAVSWNFTSIPGSTSGLTVVGTIAYEVSGLGTNPLPTMRTASATTSTAIDSGATGNLQFGNEFILATAVTHSGSTAGPGGWTSTNSGTNNSWAGYQIAVSSGSSYDWAQTGTASDYWSAGIVSVLANSTTGGPYRIFNGVNGPASPVAYAGNFLAGVTFQAIQTTCWLQGYWWWVCASGQSTAPTKCALWQHTGQGSGHPTLVPGSVVTSSALTAGQWNYIALPTPVQVSIGTVYIAAVAVNGNFPDTNNTWGQNQIYPSGVTLGPLNCFGKWGPNQADYGLAQGVFTTSGNDPAITCPEGGSGTDNFWVDVQLTDQAPSNYVSTYRLWPNSAGSQVQTSADSAVDYVVGTEIDLTKASVLNKIWYFSPGGTAQLATQCGVWSMATQQLVAQSTSPVWSGAAASGWVSCSFNGVLLPIGKYRVAVYNGAATPDQWSSKQLEYWTWSSPGMNGITSGPLYAPTTGSAQNANIYQGSGSEPGQAVFAVGPPNAYPNLYVDNLYQNYWVDMEVTIAANSVAFLNFFP